VILEHLLTQIKNHQLAPGDQIPTELELSEMFKVSRITAMRAVKELEHMGVVFRMKARGTFVAPQSEWRRQGNNENNEALAPPISIISIILPFEQQHGYEILQGAEKAAGDKGYYVTMHNSMNDPIKEREIIEQLRSDGVKGIVLYPCKSSSNIAVVSDLMINRYPFIIIDRNIVGLEVPSVVSNNYQGAYDIVNYLIGLGHRKIAFLCRGMSELESIMERYRGYCKALIDAGIPLRKEWVIDTLTDLTELPDNGPEHQEEVDNAVLDRWMTPNDSPTAVVSLNDMTALFLLKAAIERGIKIPEELSITGFDNLSFSSHLEVPLTTIEQSLFAMGEEAVTMLINDIRTGTNQVRKIVLDTRLIIRESACPPIATAIMDEHGY